MSMSQKNMSQYRIISICERTVNIIGCALEGASSITIQGEMGISKKCVFVSKSRPHKANEFRLS